VDDCGVLQVLGLRLRDAHLRQRATWEVGRDRILTEVEHLAIHVPSPHVRRGARALKRELASIDRKLA
jgi:hypothetical protein